jgi:hydrogenase-1 operon protein HyaF
LDIKDIPVRIFGPGSQPESSDGESLSYIDMPSDMATYQKPYIPEPDALTDLAGAREAMQWLLDALQAFAESTTPMLVNLSALDDKNRDLVNQILGEGEVSVKYDGEVTARSQESVLAGAWRTLYFDENDAVCCDVLEVADIPHTVRRMEGRSNAQIDLKANGVPSESVNALAILSELRSHCASYAASGKPHSINLTLLPLAEAEIELLDNRLGRGPVDVLSRAYGKCQVISTATANVWWVRYYNTKDTLILNSLEVVAVPNVVAAAVEDISDSAERLREILEPYWSDVA